jgi:integrase
MPAVKLFAEQLVLSGRSRAMAGKILSTLRMILTDAQGRGLVGQNVAKGVKLAVSKRHKKNVAVPARSDLKAMLETAEAKFPDFYPLLLTAVFTGLRSSELRGLRREDIDLKGATISVEQRADAWGVIGSPKSAAGFRTIPVPPMLVAVLRVWLMRAPKSPLGLAFPTSTGGVRLHSNMLNREFWPLQIAAGVAEPTGKKDADGNDILKARVGFHGLRHAAASAWINQRVDLKRLMTWLGHSTIQMTMDTYGHLIADDAADAAIAAAAEAALFA